MGLVWLVACFACVEGGPLPKGQATNLAGEVPSVQSPPPNLPQTGNEEQDQLTCGDVACAQGTECKMEASGPRCADLDECALGVSDCRVDEVCLNTLPGFICVPESSPCADNPCEAGYDCVESGDVPQCVDQDECAVANACPGSADCEEREGATTPRCVDRPQCTNGEHNCEPDQVCVELDSAPGFVCEDIEPEPDPEPDPDPDPEPIACADIDCEAGSVCVETPGADAFCTDVDECVDGTDDCGAEETCVNASPGFQCVANESPCASSPCGAGYDCVDNGDEAECVDQDECAVANACPPSADCQNRLGATEPLCVDRLQCENGEHTCAPDENCVELDTAPGFLCEPPPTFPADGFCGEPGNNWAFCEDFDGQGTNGRAPYPASGSSARLLRASFSGEF